MTFLKKWLLLLVSLMVMVIVSVLYFNQKIDSTTTCQLCVGKSCKTA